MSATRAIGIVRVSQRDKDALSPEVQRRAIVALAAEHGWSLRDEDILDENLDTNGKVRNVSGSWELKDRPKLRHAIEEVEAGRAKVIVAERFDRMFRNEILRRMVVKRLEDGHGQLWDKDGQMTHQRAEGRLGHNVKGDVSEYTLETARERSWDAVEVAIEQGKSGSPTPLGYLKGADGVLVPDPTKVKVVQEAFERRAGGASAVEIKTFLATHQIKRTISGVYKMLASRLYVGEIHFGKHTPNLNAHEPIIDRDLFERVQKKVVRQAPGRKAKSERLLARLGILRCGTCGARMSVSSNGTGYPLYRCANRDDCPQRVTIMAELIEKVAVETVIEHRKSVKGQARGERQAREAQEAAAEAQDKLAAAIRLLDDFGDEEAAHERLAALRADRDSKREAAERLAAAFPPVVTVDAEAVFADGTLEEKRSVIRDTIERISIAPGRGDRITIKLLGQ